MQNLYDFNYKIISKEKFLDDYEVCMASFNNNDDDNNDSEINDYNCKDW